MEIRFKEKEVDDLAMLLRRLYDIKESAENITSEICYAVKITDLCQAAVQIVIDSGYVYATLPSKPVDELVGVRELVGTIMRKGRDYVYAVK